jgi:hypothetical protein
VAGRPAEMRLSFTSGVRPMVPRILLWIGIGVKNERKVGKPQARGKFERWGSDPNAGAGDYSASHQSAIKISDALGLDRKRGVRGDLSVGVHLFRGCGRGIF